MGTPDPIDLWCLDMRRRGLAQGTIECRRSGLRTVRLEAGEPFGLDSEQIERWLDCRQIGARTRYCWLSNLHAYYAWAMRHGLADRDPTVLIDRPKLPKLLPRPAPVEQIAMAVRHAAQPVRTWILLAALAGFRCREIALLTWEDVLDGLDPPGLVARGKGDKPRVIPAHPRLLDALGRLPRPHAGPVFLRHGHPWSAHGLSRAGNDVLHELGLDWTMHKLRHTFATGVYRSSGRDLLLTQALLGHSSPTTTAIYAEFDRRGAVEAVGALNL